MIRRQERPVELRVLGQPRMAVQTRVPEVEMGVDDAAACLSHAENHLFGGCDRKC